MYFDGTTLTTLLSDAETAAANAPAIAAPGPRYTSPLAVIEAAIALPELGEAGVTAFLDAHGIELRDMPPGLRLIEGALATDGKLKARLHAASAAYYETDVAVLPLPVPVALPLSEIAPTGEALAGEAMAGEAMAGEPDSPQTE